MKKKLIAMILTGSMLTATFAGCGSTSSGSSNTATSASTTVASSASASSTLTLDEIKKKGQLVVATEAAYEPFEYLDDDGETIIGYNADLFNQICDDLGVKLVYQDLPFQGILAGLDAHKYDVVGATLGITAERAKSYTMTEPIEKGTTVLIKRKGDNNFTSLDDVNGTIVGTQTSCYNETDMKNFNKELKSKGGKGYSDLKTYDHFTEAYSELTNKQIDLVAQNYASAASLVKKYPDQFEIVTNSDGKPAYVTNTDVWLGWAVRKSDSELADYINSEIEKFKENGFLKKEQEKWFGQTVDLPSDNYIPESDS